MAGHGVETAEGGVSGDAEPQLGDAAEPCDVLGREIQQDRLYHLSRQVSRDLPVVVLGHGATRCHRLQSTDATSETYALIGIIWTTGFYLESSITCTTLSPSTSPYYPRPAIICTSCNLHDSDEGAHTKKELFARNTWRTCM
jgi:hypothetical protein